MEKIDDLRFEEFKRYKGPILEPSAEICIPCRGAKYLCGRSYCPILVKHIGLVRGIELKKRVIEGSSPPSVFVGRFGYPNVRIGPLVPAEIGDTSSWDLPESWTNLSLEEILSFRLSMLRSYKYAKIEEARNQPSWLIEIQELAGSKKPVDLLLKLKEIPSGKNFFDDIVQPMGPSARLEEMNILSNIRMDERIEKAYYDKDLKAGDAIFLLYTSGLEISKISKALSVGMLGAYKNRKLVPTRWSITAVDDTVSKKLLEKVRQYQEIDKIRVFFMEKHLNKFLIIMFPEKWSYEWIEAWYPRTTWNLFGKEAEVESDSEGFKGRKEYASLGGCYYSVRLAVSEYLSLIKRQATVLAIREILPGFVTSVGVWFVRESIREMLKKSYTEFEDIKEALKYSFSKLNINKEKLINKSKILKRVYFQEKLKNYLNKFYT